MFLCFSTPRTPEDHGPLDGPNHASLGPACPTSSRPISTYLASRRPTVLASRRSTVALAAVLASLLAACSAPEPAGPDRANSDLARSDLARSEDAAQNSTESATEIGRQGGRLALAMTEEPRTFNPITAIANPSLAVVEMVHGDLMHFDPERFEVAPALAETVQVSDDGRIYRLGLRRDVRFSDGEPFDAEDVLFTFRALLDPETESVQADALSIDGQPVTVRAIDNHTVEVELPTALANGGQLFDTLAILPEHVLGEPYRAGELAAAWGIGTDPEQLVGLGPFRVLRHEPGQRLVLERNPHYWKRDRAGNPLPYLEQVVISYVADEEARMLRFLAGESDLVASPSPDSFLDLRQRAGIAARDLGPGLAYEFLFFNLNDLEPGQHPEIAGKQKWFRQRDFRKALSLAIDRQAIARLVHRGLATPVAGPVTAANRRWYEPSLRPDEHDPERALDLLEGLGFRRGDDGLLRTAEGEAVALTMVTNSSNARRVRTGTVIQEDLRRIGIRLDVVPLDFGALLDRVYESLDFELCLLGLGRGSTDPTSAMNVWHSNGDSHLWQIAQRPPLPAWQIELDSLLDRQRLELDPQARKALYGQVQQRVVEQLPFVFLVAPNVLAAAKPELGNFAPMPVEPVALWNLEHLYWRGSETR